MDFPRELREQFTRGNGVLFVGAGLSMGAGLPGWIGLVRPLAQAIGYPLPEDKFITTDHLLSAAQFYEDKHGRNSLIRYLIDKLDLRVQPTTVHQLIASLPVQIIFTTNYDNLIERALDEAGKRANVVVSEPELAFWSEDCVQVVKLCGSLGRPESICIAQGDFNTYFATHSQLAQTLRTILQTKTALFLGYGLHDPFFNQIWDHIGLDFGRVRRHGHAVLFDADSFETVNFERCSIHVVNLESAGRDRTALLVQWLEGLNPGAA